MPSDSSNANSDAVSSLASAEIMRLARELFEVLSKKNQTVSFAESCTGGLLSAALTELAGVSDVYLGSVVSYAYPAKIDLLGVDSETLVTQGAVSSDVACQMAQGALNQFKSDWSVSITGIAGPGGATPNKPVGTVCFAVCSFAGEDKPPFVLSDTQYFQGDRVAVREASVRHALTLLLSSICKA